MDEWLVEYRVKIGETFTDRLLLNKQGQHKKINK